MLETRLYDTDRERGDRDASVVEDREELREPAPRSPRRLASGTRHPLNERPCVSDVCQPILRYGGITVRPGVPAGTMIAEISPGPVRAVTVTST